MNFNQYRALARRTMNSDLDKPLQAAVAALGLVGEACEFILALAGRQSIDEAGDVCWYMAWLCDIYQIRNLTGYDSGNEDVLTIAARVADMVKKNVGHNHPMPVAVLQRWLEGILWLLEVDYGDLTEVYETNIAKLRKRYPDGFSVERSINRIDG